MEQIAEELEEDIDYVAEICKAAKNETPDYAPRWFIGLGRRIESQVE